MHVPKVVLVGLSSFLAAAACSSSVAPSNHSIAGIRVTFGGVGGPKQASVSLGDSIAVAGVPVSASGTAIDTAVTISFVSRQPAIAAVSTTVSGTQVFADSLGVTYIVGSLASNGQTYRDSVMLTGVGQNGGGGGSVDLSGGLRKMQP